jgi:hypothetical protein
LVGVDRANEKFCKSKQQATFATGADVIRLLQEKHSILGDVDNQRFSPIDLDEIWFNGK